MVRRNNPDRTKEHHMPTYSIDTENNLAVHPDKDTAIKEAGATGAAFASEAQLSEAIPDFHQAGRRPSQTSKR